MSDLRPPRRLTLACAAIGIAGLILRPTLATALVSRGDELLYRSSARGALTFYRRALWLDPMDRTAIDRMLFVSTSIRDRDGLRLGIRRATRYLASRPGDSLVRLDRAMAYRALRQPTQAVNDFAIVGHAERNARALAFAGFAALAIGRRHQARSYWRSALVLAPQLAVARRALVRTRTIR